MKTRPPTWLLVSLATLAFVVWSIHSSEKERMARKDAPVRSGPPCTTNAGWHYARSEDVLDMAGRIVQQGDTAAFAKLIASGRLKPLKDGVPVYLEPGGRFGHAAIRLPGSLDRVWVLNEALTCQK